MSRLVHSSKTSTDPVQKMYKLGRGMVIGSRYRQRVDKLD